MTLRPTTRACSGKELRFLRNQRDALRRRRRTLWQRSLGAYVGIFGLLAVLTLWAVEKNPRFILGFWGALGGLIVVPGFVQEWHRLSRQISAYDHALAAGQAEELTVTARRFWEFEERDDEGASYAFELVAGGVLFISGQDFYAGARFPSLDFSIVEFRDVRGRNFEMLIEKRGAKSAPERLISAQEKVRLGIPTHGSFSEGSLPDVLVRLQSA